MSTTRVQIIAQPFPATRTSTAVSAGPVSPRRDVGFDDALFLLVAEGRRPTRPEMLLFSLGFAATLSLVFITSDLMNGKPTKPAIVVIFFLSVSYCAIVVRRQRAAAADFAAEQERLAAESRRAPPNVIDKETRHRLLNYFVLRPPEEEKKGDTSSNKNNDSNSSSSSSSVTTTGRRFGGSMFSLLPTPASVSSRPAPPAYESPLRSVERNRSGDGDSGEGQESSAGAADGGQSQDDEESAGATAAAAAAAATTGMVDMTAVVPAGKETGEEHLRCSSPKATGAQGLDGGEAKGEWSTAGSCIVCFGDYAYGEELCRLPCLHVYHAKCIDEWLDGPNHGWCPLCKTDVVSAATSFPTTDGSTTATSSNNNSDSGGSGGGGGGSSRRERMLGTIMGRLQTTDRNLTGHNAV